ncbi:hypothetical protein M0R45_002184 [Rubus argutus]|uniref:Uncharacterized protein n=1 Tax=Rubus argutus TaxID=59490 RepID=A0AAW1VRS0_RUBAR
MVRGRSTTRAPQGSRRRLHQHSHHSPVGNKNVAPASEVLSLPIVRSREDNHLPTPNLDMEISVPTIPAINIQEQMVPCAIDANVSQLLVEQSSSLDSVPPGFLKFATEVPASSSNSTPVATGIIPPLAHFNSELCIGTTSIVLEEGEFTPVESKRSKKLSKQSKKSKPKSKLRNPSIGRALPIKGARNKLH